MIIKVTEDDIRRGVRRNPSGCMIARAAQRATGFECKMGCYVLSLKPGGPCYEVPDYVSTRREAFDMGMRVKPFAFEIPSELVSRLSDDVDLRVADAEPSTEELALVP
jgi:hypothetical protein